MSGIPRIRTRFERDLTSKTSPTAGMYRQTLGVFSLETSSGAKVPIPGFNPVSVDVSTDFHKGMITRDSTHKGPPYYEGSNFSKRLVEFPDPRVVASGTYDSGDHTETFFGLGTGRVWYSGGFFPIHWSTGFDWGSWLSPSATILSTADWELQAYKRTRPKLEKASAAIFTAELRDLPRMLRTTSGNFHDVWKRMDGDQRTKLMSPHRVADNFLNHQFGWVPFVSDLGKFYMTFQNSAAIKARLTAQNDKYIRRRVVLEDKQTDRIIASGGGMQVEPVGYLVQALFAPGQGPTWELRERTHSYVSAVGSYKYYSPQFDDSLPDYNSAWNNVVRDLTIYGARLSPSNVYRATPWTWLLDWFTDFSTNIDAFTDIAIDAVAARYLYVSKHVATEQILTQTLPFRDGAVQASWSIKWDEKVRNGASTPYGFGLSWNLLSPGQLAILAALKITR